MINFEQLLTRHHHNSKVNIIIYVRSCMHSYVYVCLRACVRAYVYVCVCLSGGGREASFRYSSETIHLFYFLIFENGSHYVAVEGLELAL